MYVILYHRRIVKSEGEVEEEDEDESGWTEFNSIDTAALLYYYIYYYYYTNYDYDYDSFKGAVAGGEGVELYEELVSAGR